MLRAANPPSILLTHHTTPTVGTNLEALPFPTTEHLEQLAGALHSILREGTFAMGPREALETALHTKPNLVFHIQVGVWFCA